MIKYLSFSKPSTLPALSPGFESLFSPNFFENFGKIKRDATLEGLPVELQLIFLHNIPDVASSRAVVYASPLCH